jgi:hypothetical protein
MAAGSVRTTAASKTGHRGVHPTQNQNPVFGNGIRILALTESMVERLPSTWQRKSRMSTMEIDKKSSARTKLPRGMKANRCVRRA